MTPMTFRAGAVNAASPTPMFEQLANRMRAAIQAGELEPGEALPSEGEIARRVHVSRPTVREAIDVLVTEGLLRKRRGAATVVATPEPVRHIASTRYQESLDRLRAGDQEPSSAFIRDHGAKWPPAIKAAYDEVEPITDERQALELTNPDDLVLRRTLIKAADGEWTQLQYSAYPLDLVRDTPVADPDNQPWNEGTIGELYSLGIVVNGVWEKVRARPRTGFERETLDLASCPWVFEVHRRFFARVGKHTSRPVEYSVAVVSGARHAMEYYTPLQ